MHVKIFDTSDALAQAGAKQAAAALNEAIDRQGKARLLLSTGASQVETIRYLTSTDVRWDVVEVFHLDEYLNLSFEHPASFRKYIKARFADVVHPKAVHYVEGGTELSKSLSELSTQVQREPIDVALIGIGENGHIAFNDPPADFDTQAAYIVVHLDERCKFQQVREGWFANVSEVPSQAITMTPYQILQSNKIISCVPYAVKAEAVKLTLESKETNEVPATILKRHPDVTLYLDTESASLVSPFVLQTLVTESGD